MITVEVEVTPSGPAEFLAHHLMVRRRDLSVSRSDNG